MRIQSVAPGNTTASKLGPMKLPSLTCQLILSPSGVMPTTSLLTVAVSDPRNFVSHAQRGRLASVELGGADNFALTTGTMV